MSKKKEKRLVTIQGYREYKTGDIEIRFSLEKDGYKTAGAVILKSDEDAWDGIKRALDSDEYSALVGEEREL